MTQRLLNTNRGALFEIEVDGRRVAAFEGETLATVLMAAGIRSFAVHPKPHPPSRLFCGMGTCQQCLVTINDLPNCQACRVLARPNMKVVTCDER